MSQSQSRLLTDVETLDFRESYSPYKIPFSSESLYIFFRSNTSWHSFEYPDQDLGPRYSININLLYPVSSDV